MSDDWSVRPTPVATFRETCALAQDVARALEPADPTSAACKATRIVVEFFERKHARLVETRRARMRAYTASLRRMTPSEIHAHKVASLKAARLDRAIALLKHKRERLMSHSTKRD